MSIADRIPATLAARAALAAARAGERAARDAFIVAQYPAQDAAFDALLREALGLDTRIALTATPLSLPVQGRSFATLPLHTWSARSTLLGPAQTVSFTPDLDFRERDQFGVIACAIDFAFVAGRGRADRIAQSLLDRGVLLCGRTHAGLFLALDDGLRELTATDLEDAFGVWWLR